MCHRDLAEQVEVDAITDLADVSQARRRGRGDDRIGNDPLRRNRVERSCIREPICMKIQALGSFVELLGDSEDRVDGARYLFIQTEVFVTIGERNQLELGPIVSPVVTRQDPASESVQGKGVQRVRKVNNEAVA